jgi:hypothetical protein
MTKNFRSESLATGQKRQHEEEMKAREEKNHLLNKLHDVGQLTSGQLALRGSPCF